MSIERRYSEAKEIYGKLGVDVDAAAAELGAFPDNKTVSGYAKAPMAWAVGAGMIGGTTRPGTDKLYLDPQGNATRAQAAKILVEWVYYLEFVQ